MRIFCSICKDNFIPYSEVLVTNCGHLYHGSCIWTWMKQHRTCPQCRASLSQPFRVYFDVEKDKEEDPSTLQHQLETISDKLREMERHKKQLVEEKKDFQKLVQDMKERALSITKKNDVLKTSVKALKEQVTKLVKQNEAIVHLESAVETWKNKAETLQKVETLIKGSIEEVNKMVESTPITALAVKQLCTYVGVLKAQLHKTEAKNMKLVQENRDISRVLAEERRKHFNESEEIIKNLKVKNSKLENDLESLNKVFKEYKSKYSRKSEPVPPPHNIASKLSIKKNMVDVNLDVIDEEPSGSLRQLLYQQESNKTISHWEELVCAGPSKNFGLSLRNSRSFNKAFCNQDENDTSRSTANYAFDGLGGRKKVRLGVPTPAEELEQIKRKDKKHIQTNQHKKIIEYYQAECQS